MKLNTPTKFGKGVGLLWRGCRLDEIHFFIKHFWSLKSQSSTLAQKSDFYLFESARSALFKFLLSLNKTKKNKIVVSSFTCEAVTYSIVKAGFVPVYVDVNDDLTMNENMVFESLDDSIRAVIVQNSFGRIGLSIAAISDLRKKGLIVIEDCALSYGSSFENKALGSFGDVSIFSLETSKTVTVGWGGIITIQNFLLQNEFDNAFQNSKSISVISDFRRLTQLWFSLLMVKVNKSFFFPLWYMFYGFRVFRTSNKFSTTDNLLGKKMGILTQTLFFSFQKRFGEVFKITNSVYIELALYSESLGLNPLVRQKNNEMIVSPRISFLVNKKYHSDLFEYAGSLSVEVGRWFSECPPQLYLNHSIIHSSEKSKEISEDIINLSSHYTLSKNELKNVKRVIKFIAKC